MDLLDGCKKTRSARSALQAVRHRIEGTQSGLDQFFRELSVIIPFVGYFSRI